VKFLSALLTCLFIAGCADTVTAPKPSISTNGDPDQYASKGDPDRWWQPQSDTNKWWSPSARKIKHAAAAIVTLVSENGVVTFSDALFADHLDSPIVFYNTFGTAPYVGPCFKIEKTDGSLLNNEYPYFNVCALLHIYNPDPTGDIKLSQSFDFRVEIAYDPDYALSYMALPRYVVTILPL
jgi:hypothetical protein